jgi:hypothetical protein
MALVMTEERSTQKKRSKKRGQLPNRASEKKKGEPPSSVLGDAPPALATHIISPEADAQAGDGNSAYRFRSEARRHW